MIKEHISLPECLVVDEGTDTCFMALDGNYCHPFLRYTSLTLILFACSCLKIGLSLPSCSLEEMNWIITFFIGSKIVIIFLCTIAQILYETNVWPSSHFLFL